MSPSTISITITIITLTITINKVLCAPPLHVPLMDKRAAYVTVGEQFSRTCVVWGGVAGAPDLVLDDDEGIAFTDTDRIKILVRKDHVANKTMGTFLLTSAQLEDNQYAKVRCRNVAKGRTSQFKLKILPVASIPTIEINATAPLVVSDNTTLTLTCTLVS